MERNPLPDPAAWRAIGDPEKRLVRGLEELYRYYAANEGMFARVMRDAEVHDLTREMLERNMAPMRDVHEALAEGLARRGRRRARLDAALDLALHFATWRVLVRSSGLPPEEAGRLMARMVLCAAGRPA